MTHTYAAVSRLAVEHYPPGQQPTGYDPGDFILTRSDSFYGRLIRFGQGLRIHGEDRRFTHWNHAALVVGTDGALVEALGNGVCHTNASKYQPRDFHLVRTGATPQDREQVVAFAMSVGSARYGWLTIASIALSMLTGSKFSFTLDGTYICSQLVAESQERTAAIFDRDPVRIAPADLAKYYQVPSPS